MAGRADTSRSLTGRDRRGRGARTSPDALLGRAGDSEKPTRGESGLPSAIEKAAPAYQEDRPWHRAHVGTGTKGPQKPDPESIRRKRGDEPDDFEGRYAAAVAEYDKNVHALGADEDSDGMTSQTYRNHQRELIESVPEGVGAATQLNQLGYAFASIEKDDGTKTRWQERDVSDPATAAANVSYHRMVNAMAGKVDYLDEGERKETAEVDEFDRAEMHIARLVSETGQWPHQWDDDTKKRVLREVGDLPPAVLKQLGLADVK